MKPVEKLKIGLFIFSGLTFILIGIFKFFSIDKIPWLGKNKQIALQGSDKDVCSSIKENGDKTFFVSCSGFLE